MKSANVREGRCDSGEVTNRYQTIGPQAVRFNKNSCLFKPGEEMFLRAVELDIAKSLIA